MYPTQTFQKRRRAAILFIVFMLLVTPVVVYVHHESFIKKVTFIPEGGTITIGTVDPETGGLKEPLGSSSKAPSIRLHTGRYAVVYAQSGHSSATKLVTLSQSLNLTLPVLDLSAQSLNALKTTEGISIQKVLISAASGHTYTTQDLRFYAQGQWASAHLVPADGSDTLSVILLKNNNSWSIQAGPAILIAISEHPAIPEEIIRYTNNF